MDFVAIDVETANSDLASICQIGLVAFEASQVVGRFSVLLDPRDYFAPVNVGIHGITPEMVEGKLTFGVAFPAIAKRLRDQIVIHHTPFDRVAICRAVSRHGLSEVSCRWLDSAMMARRTWERFSKEGYGLANLAAEFGIQFHHHDASEDAYAAGLIALRAIEESGTALADWPDFISRSIAASKVAIKRDGNPDGELHGECVVFTGTLAMPRRVAADIAAKAGCKVASSVTAGTTILVIGDQDIRRFNGSEKSEKHRRAEAMIIGGLPIRIIGESDFLAAVNYRPD